MPSKEDIEDLRKSTSFHNWDDENAPPITHWDEAESLLEFLDRELPDFPVCGLSPCGDGFIHFYWSYGGIQAVVELGPKSKFVAYHYTPDSNSSIYEFKNKSDLSAFVRQLYDLKNPPGI